MTSHSPKLVLVQQLVVLDLIDQAIETVLVVTPSCAVTAMVVVPGMLVAAVTTALAFVSVVVAATVGTTLFLLAIPQNS